MAEKPSQHNIDRMNRFATVYSQKSGTSLHPDPAVTEAVVLGLAKHQDQLGKPLCPCRFYPDKQEEIKRRTWICACDDMKQYKYCHCLLFVRPDGLPVTEHLPEDHEGRRIYGITADPTPDKGRESGR